MVSSVDKEDDQNISSVTDTFRSHIVAKLHNSFRKIC